MSVYLRPSPLVNKSVSCWLNVIIQSLGSCPTFCHVIREGISDNIRNPVYMAFGDYILTNLRGYDTRESSTVILNALNKLTRETGRNAKLTQQQQCALEFLELIISSLKSVDAYRLFRSYYIRDTKCTICGHVSRARDAVSHVDIFKSSTVPNYHDGAAFKDQPKLLLDYLGHREILSAWECPECYEETHDVESVVRLIHPAKVIVFVFDKAMDNSAVILPESLAIRQQKRDDGDSQDIIKYIPVAVIQHYGTTDSGHYIANCLRRSPEGKMKWYRCNDDVIHEVACDPLAGANMFMAFYAIDE